MSGLRKLWTVVWQLGLCTLLMTWILETIFKGEAQQALGMEPWNKLSRAQQWVQAWSIGPAELWRTLRLVPVGTLLLSLFLAWLMVFLGVIRWRMALAVQGINLSLARSTAITFVSQFFSSFMFGSTGGDLIKAYYAARETHHKKTEAVVTVFVDRMIGMWAMLFFAGLLMIPNFALVRSQMKIAGFCGIIFAMLAGASGVLFLAFWGGVSQRFPHARTWLRKLPKGELFERSIDSCRQFGKRRGFLLKTMLISLLINVVVVLQSTVLAGALGLEVDSVALWLIVPMVVCISALPIAPGGGTGVREYLYIFILGCLAPPVGKTLALSLSLLSYAPTLFWNLAGGVVYLGLKKRERLQEVTHAGAAE